MIRLELERMIPGGVRPTDKVHRGTNDGTCSRCGRDTEDEVPLMLWSADGEDLLIYCDACTDEDAWGAMAPMVPK